VQPLHIDIMQLDCEGILQLHVHCKKKLLLGELKRVHESSL